MNYKLQCTKCGYARPITSEWLEDLRMKFSLSTSGLVVENIETYLPRFKCSKCSAKVAHIIPCQIEQRLSVNREQEKDRYTKWILGMAFTPLENGQGKTEPTKWSKRTCPACNGDGLGGNCYRCDGTGWVEALF